MHKMYVEFYVDTVEFGGGEKGVRICFAFPV